MTLDFVSLLPYTVLSIKQRPVQGKILEADLYPCSYMFISTLMINLCSIENISNNSI